MRNRKVWIIYVPILILVIIGIIGINVFSQQSVQKSMEEIETNSSWNKVMSDTINKKNINLCVDGRTVELQSNELYMSENMELMLPIHIITEVFDCAQNLYEGKKLVVAKGSNKATMHIGKSTLNFNDNDYRLAEAVQSIEDKVYVPVSLFSQYLGYEYKWDSGNNTAYFQNAADGDSFLPERYSYIEEKRVPNVKDQGKYGTCWAFATLTAIESTLMPEEVFDFSENNLVYNNELSEGIQDGGDYIMAMAYLMSWRGPVLEQDDPYGDRYSNTELEAVKHIQGAEILPAKDYEQIKEKVFKYGGVESSMYMSMNNSKSTSVYYNSKKYAYCYTGDNNPNHDVLIIGWDDNFSKEKFNDENIEGDGAFICLNSWGADFGENGVFYVSYYDDCIGINNVCYTDIEDTDNYNNIYQSDLCGWTGTMGFEGKNSAYFANVYLAEDNEKVKAVGFYAATNDLEYDIFVCENYRDKNSLNERNHLAATGSLENKGYYTIKLDKGYNINAGEKFAVIVKVTGNAGDKVYKIIPVEMPTDEMENEVDLTDGEGYFSSEGYNWQSAEKQNCNICLKAYTNNENILEKR